MNPSGHVLIIDDEAVLRQTMARILLRAGFEVTTVASGKESLTIIQDHTFDLIYLDIRMPDMNGLDVLKTIHEKFPEWPVILFTAQPDLHSAVEALRRGAIDYLMKPLKPEVIVERTRQIIGEQNKKKRRREIEHQMAELQAELDTLDDPEVAEKKASTNAADGSSDRFL